MQTSSALLCAALLASASATPAPMWSKKPAATSYFADPALIQDVNGDFYTFSTSHDNVYIPYAKTSDFKNFDVLPGSAMPKFPKWATPKIGIWAPDVVQLVRLLSTLPSQVADEDRDPIIS
jgi:hypothetical protein